MRENVLLYQNISLFSQALVIQLIVGLPFTLFNSQNRAT